PPQAEQVDCNVHAVAGGLGPVGQVPPTQVPVKDAGAVVVCPAAANRRLVVRHAGAEQLGVVGGVEVGHAMEQLGQVGHLGSDAVHAPVPVWFTWSMIESTLIASPNVSAFVNVMLQRIVPPGLCDEGSQDFWMVPPWTCASAA